MPEVSYEDLQAENIRREVELEQYMNQKELKSGNEKYSMLDLYSQMLAASNKSINATDSYGIIMYWNKGAEKLFGWKSTEVIGKPIIDFTPTKMSLEQAENMMKKLGEGLSWSGEFHVWNINEMNSG